MRRVIITGANGFIGSQLRRQLNESGFETIAWLRKPSGFDFANSSGFFDIRMPEKSEWPENVHSLIHCAWILDSSKHGIADINIKAVEYLSRECEKRGINFIFISSFSAHSDAISVYGKSKFSAQSILSPEKTLILKPGLVLGNGGLFKKMVKLVGKSPVLPVPGKGMQMFQTILVNDLCRLIIAFIQENRKGIIELAHDEAVSLINLYRLIKKYLGKRALILPLPFGLMLFMASILETLGIGAGIRRENILGAKQSFIYNTTTISEEYQLLSVEESLERLIGSDVKQILR